MNAQQDMEHLAKWTPALESYAGQRAEWLDDFDRELWRAVLIQRRITAVALRDMRSAILLVDLYLRNNGSGSRIEEHVAVRWLPASTVRGWLLNWRLNIVAAQRATERVRSAAHAHYESVSEAECEAAAAHTALVWMLLNRMEQHGGRSRDEVKAMAQAEDEARRKAEATKAVAA